MRRTKAKNLDSSKENKNSKPSESRDISNIDKTILDNFYKLVHSQEHIRIKAALSTFKILVAFKKQNQNRFNQHLNYCVERLVAGLASSRALARRGYAMLSLELLKHFQFSTDKLLNHGEKKFGNISHESKDNLVAYYLLISVILESGNYKIKVNKDSEYVGRIFKLLKQLRFRKSYFDFPVNKLLVKYYEVFRPFMEGEDILDRLAEPPKSVLNGVYLGKHTENRIETLFNDCSAEVLDIYLDKLLGVFYKEHGSEAHKLHYFCARQMAHLIRRPQMVKRHKPIMKLCRFLVVNELFKYVDPAKKPESFWAELGVEPSMDQLSIKTRKSLRIVLHTTLDLIVSTCDAQDRLKYLKELIIIADNLITADAVKFYDSVGNVAELWPYYMNSLNNHLSLTKKKGQPKILFPVTGLYLFYGLQILEHGLDCKEQLDDLAESAKEALKDDPSDGSWADVLTDQIIAILSATECNPWIRRLCVSIFGSLLQHISETSIELICSIFKMPDEEDDREEDDGEDDSGAEVVQYSDGGDKMSVCEEDPDRVRKLEEAIKNSLEKSSTSGGQNNAKDDGDKEEEEYLNDEQMMKLDSVIAVMFKMKKGKKKDPTFQLRCLDLVKKIIQKKRADSELIRKIRNIIVPYANKCKRYKELLPIADKISRMLGSSSLPHL